MTATDTPIARLARTAQAAPDRLAFGYVRDGETLSAELSYGELNRRAELAAAALLVRAAPGDRILLTLKPGPAFAVALFGCWRAGMVPVPAYPPRPNRPNDRAFAIAEDAGATLAMVLDEPRADTMRALEAGNIQCIDVGSLPEAEAPPWFDWPADGLHLLQYTSGSTSDPRGVAVSAAALAENLDAITLDLRPPSPGTTVSWLPHFHDFGLIEATIQTVWRGDTAYLLSPTEFVKQPLNWLKAMSRFRATETQAPNFAFDLVNRTSTAEDMAGLDLSSLGTVIVGAEPIRKPVMDRFFELVAPTGFRREAMVYGYGMAETTLGASAAVGAPLYRAVDPAALERGEAVPAPEGEPSRDVACCGPPLRGFEAAIVDPADMRKLPADRVGELWLRGPSLAMGYWRNPEANAEIFEAHTADGSGPWLRTGDLAFTDDTGRIYITGRLKDLILVAGRNHYPQDVEATARAADPQLATGRGAAFALDGEARDSVVIVQEIRRDAGSSSDGVIETLRRAIADEHGIELDAVMLVRAGTLPVTSSGKIQRRATRQAWREGQLAAIAEWRREPPALETPLDTPLHDPMVQRLIGFAAELSGLPPEKIDPTESLAHLGLGSIEATRLMGQIESAFGLSVDPTTAYTHPTIAQLAQLIVERTRQVAADAVGAALGGLSQSMGVAAPQAEPDTGIAIVGMACRLPGASDVESLWRMTLEGRRAIGPVPEGRSDLAATFANLPADVPRRGGFLDSVDGFDPGFFKLAPAEASLLDPQHRLFLEVAWEALEGLADAPDHWAGRKVGVFVGVSQVDYVTMLARAGQLSAAHTPTGNAHNMAANRLSYLLDLKGPSVAVDTACSSSLVALTMAVRSIEAGDCDMAIVGGTNLTLDGGLTEAFRRAGMLAADGACKSFDASADGYGRGEGCGVVILKRSADARADGDHVWAQVAGMAINQDGLSNGLTAPNGNAQEEVIRAALASAGIEGSALAYVEAHGTGTPLGDPVEANALAAALGAPATRRAIGTIKANIGHLEAAAGIAGLIKAALVLDRRIVPPLAGLGEINPLVENAARSFDLPRQAVPLAADANYAGVSSFGFGGTNAHVILRSGWAAPGGQAAPAGPVALCLSARDEDGLRAVAMAWRDAMRAAPGQAASLWAANALRRRAALRHRLAVTGGDANELAEQLDRWLAGEHPVPTDPTASTWLAGGRPDWRAIWGEGPLPLLALPTYPFQRQRCWIAAAPEAPLAAGGDVEAQLTAIIARLLGLDAAKLDRDERFIEMGADSIVLAGAVREIEQRFGTTINFRQILEATPTIATLAGHLARTAAPKPAPLAKPTTLDGILGETERTIATLLDQQRQLRALVAGTAPGGIDLPAGLSGARSEPVASVWTDRSAPPETRSRALDALSARYLPRTAGSKRLAAEARPGMADARAAAGFRGSIKELLYPLAADSAAGASMTDVDGNDYVDLAMGFGVLLFGHAPDFVTRALTAEIARGMPLGPQNRIAGEVADMLRQLTGAERVAFASTGTEAVMAALRLARTVTGRRKIVVFEGAYHGHFDGVLGVAREADGRLETLPLAPGISPGAVADLVVLPYAEARSLEIIRTLGDQIAAVLVEPVQSRRPELQPDEFLHGLRTACDVSGAALVFDEMITGFRIAAGGAQAHFGVRADLVTYGKILGGGMPIGAIAGSRRFLDALDGGAWRYGDDSGPHVPTTFFAGTFNKHPLAMAGARAVLSRLIAEGPALYERLNETAATLEVRLAPILARAGIGLARFGSMFRFRHSGNADAFFYGLLDRGLYLWEGRTCFLSTVHGPEEIERIVDAVEATVREITAEAPADAVSTGSAQLLRLADIAPGAWLAYQEAAAVRLPAGTSIEVVEAALRRLAGRHAVLGGFVPVARYRLEAGLELGNLLAEARAVPVDRDGPFWRPMLVESDAAPVLMLVVHHSVVDGLSLGVLLDETARLLGGETLPAVVAPVARARVRGNGDWWQARLAELPETPALPANHARPAAASFGGASVERGLDADLWAAVQRTAIERNATPYMILAAAWSAALHRITGVQALPLGIAASGRETAEEAGLIGNFAQILPVESRLSPQHTLGEHAEAIREALLDTYARQDVDMAAVLEAMGKPFDPARPAAFPLAFNFDQGGSGASVSVPTTHAKFELALNLIRDGDHVSARLDYATDLFDRATAEAWLHGFVMLLDGLCVMPELRPAQVWASRPLTAPALPLPHMSLPDWLAASADARGDSVAVRFEGETRSYRALAERAGSIAAAIRGRVGGEEQRIAVALTPSLDLPATLWGAHWAGHAYLPIDTRHPPARLQQILAETGAALVLTDAAHREALEPLGVPLLLIAEVADGPAPPQPELTPERLAYILHTSGSTGTPKGIAISHGALVNFLASMAEAPGMSPGDTLLALTPLTFDIAALELFLPLVTGGTLAITPETVRGDGPALARNITEVAPTIIQATPSVWSLLVETGWQAPATLKLLAGGEKLSTQLAGRLTAGGAELWNMYGPTETTIWSSCGRVTPDIDLGKPVRGTTLAVLDENGEPVPPGAAGELAIGGAGLARGYWQRPDLTAERFVPTRDGGRTYLTGDLVRLGTDNLLHFLGRRDHQVKIAGHRIELDEIAAALEAMPQVTRAVALVEGEGTAVRLAAYVQSSASAETLRTQLEATLPPHLIPARLIVTATLPLTANGKIDRKALATLDTGATPTAPPAAGSEARIAAIWRDILNLDGIDADASFFALGGTSLMLAHMHVKVTREFGRDFPLVDCVRFPTIRTLARHLDAAAPEETLSAASARGRKRAERLRQLAGTSKFETGTDDA